MRIAEIGYTSNHPSIKTLTFASDESILDYDAVLWRPDGLVDEYADAYTQAGTQDEGPLLSVRASNEILADSRRRRDEFRRFLDRGRLLFISPPSTVPLRVHIIEDVLDFDLLEPLPHAPRQVRARREQSAFRGGNPFRRFIADAGYSADTEVTYPDFPGEPLFFGSETGAVHGGYIYKHPGHMLFMPLRGPTVPQQFLDPFIALVDAMESQAFALDLPDWVKDFRIDEEVNERDKLRELLSTKEDLNHQIDRARENLRQVNQRKALIGSSGNTLLQAVAAAFQSTGAVTLPGLISENCVVVEDSGHFLVVLVVGEAAEQAAPEQLDQALRTFETDFQARAKGIVIHSRASPPQNATVEASMPLNQILAKQVAARGWMYVTGFDFFHLVTENDAEKILRFFFADTDPALSS